MLQWKPRFYAVLTLAALAVGAFGGYAGARRHTPAVRLVVLRRDGAGGHGRHGCSPCWCPSARRAHSLLRPPRSSPAPVIPTDRRRFSASPRSLRRRCSRNGFRYRSREPTRAASRCSTSSSSRRRCSTAGRQARSSLRSGHSRNFSSTALAIRVTYNASVFCGAAALAGLSIPVARHADRRRALCSAVGIAAFVDYWVNLLLITLVVAVHSRRSFSLLVRTNTAGTVIPFALMASASLILVVLWQRSGDPRRGTRRSAARDLAVPTLDVPRPARDAAGAH